MKLTVKQSTYILGLRNNYGPGVYDLEIDPATLDNSHDRTLLANGTFSITDAPAVVVQAAPVEVEPAPIVESDKEPVVIEDLPVDPKAEVVPATEA